MSDLTNCFVWSCYSDHASTSSTSTPVSSQQSSKCEPKTPTFPFSNLQKTCRIYKAGPLSLREVHAELGMSIYTFSPFLLEYLFNNQSAAKLLAPLPSTNAES